MTPGLAGPPETDETSGPRPPRMVDVAGTLEVFGAPATPATVTLLGGARHALGRAAAVWLACWALVPVVVFLPVLHFVLVPGLLLGGPVLALRRLRGGAGLVRVRGRCPRCGVALDTRPGGSIRGRRTVDCPACHHDLELTLARP